MKKIGFLFVFIFQSLLVSSQTFKVDTIQYNGSSDKRINIVVLSDGYQSSEFDKFIEDTQKVINDFFSDAPYKEYRNYFNVFAIKVPSNESGASHPGTATDVTEPAHPIKEVDNYFGSTFDSFNIHRLLVTSKGSKAIAVLAANFPVYDQVLILVNTTYYGGSGGRFAIASTNEQSSELVAHEIGHSFPNLIDEYYAGDVFAREGINMTKETNPSLVKWKNWYGDNDVGIYQHCCDGDANSWYRPHQNCKMRFLGSPFCSICIEGTIEKIHVLTTPIDSYSPENNTLSDASFPIEFKLNLLTPEPNTLKIKWLLNTVELDKKQSGISINANEMITGANTVTAIIQDTTALLRKDNHGINHVYSVSWTVEKKTSGTTVSGIDKIESVINYVRFQMYPNPTEDIVNVKFSSNKEETLKIEIFNLVGEKLQTVVPNNDYITSIDLSRFPQGVYILNFTRNNVIVASKKVIKK
ncbi:MAG: M64 family metallopeptidase [Cellulophaga sp.]